MINKAQKKLMTTVTVIAAILLALLIVVTVVMYSMKEYMDQYLGRGEMITTDTGEDLDANYIEYEFNSAAESRDNAAKVTQETAEEGIVLLKNENNALPLAKSTKVTILGYYSWHNNMAGGEDPSTTENAVSIGAGIANYFDTNETVTNLYSRANGDFADPASGLDSAKSTFAEYDTAIITFKRNSGEGNDQVMDSGSAEYNRTGLSINNSELALIDYACKNFNKVIIVINAANTMELGFLDPEDPNYKTPGMYTDPYSGNTYDFSKIVGAYWAGCCGSQGGTALARILCGEVNPSGHTPDTYARYLRNDPTYVNFGNFEYSNGAQLNSYATSTFFVEYEENIYIDYYYHETAAYEAGKGNYAGYDYDTEVVYPFGYGLSYTTFSQEYAETPSFDEKSETYTFKVKVTNTGSVAGKGVAQIYVSQPYEAGQVEKAHVQLIGFGKTQILQPGESEVLTITASRDYFSSYDYLDEKAYILDAGNYKFYLSENSHSWAELSDTDTSKVWIQNVSSKIVYNEANGKRTTDETVATNVMDDELNYKFKAYNEGYTGDGYAHNMTRADFKASFPTAPTDDDYVVTDERAKNRLLNTTYGRTKISISKRCPKRTPMKLLILSRICAALISTIPSGTTISISSRSIPWRKCSRTAVGTNLPTKRTAFPRAMTRTALTASMRDSFNSKKRTCGIAALPCSRLLSTPSLREE